MKLNLSDEPITIELLRESLAHTGAALMVVSGNSMYPTLQMGWRVFVAPATGADLKVGEIAVFRGEHYLTIHRLVWKEETGGGGARLVFRGDYNRVRERVGTDAVLARVTAIELPARRRGTERIVALQGDILARFYGMLWLLYRLARPLLPKTLPPAGTRTGAFARSLFRGSERVLSLFLPSRR